MKPMLVNCASSCPAPPSCPVVNRLRPFLPAHAPRREAENSSPQREARLSSAAVANEVGYLDSFQHDDVFARATDVERTPPNSHHFRGVDPGWPAGAASARPLTCAPSRARYANMQHERLVDTDDVARLPPLLVGRRCAGRTQHSSPWPCRRSWPPQRSNNCGATREPPTYSCASCLSSMALIEQSMQP